MQRTRTGGPENKVVETSGVGYVPKVVENLVLCTKSSGNFGSKHSKILKNSYLIVNCFSFSNDYILYYFLCTYITITVFCIHITISVDSLSCSIRTSAYVNFKFSIDKSRCRKSVFKVYPKYYTILHQTHSSIKNRHNNIKNLHINQSHFNCRDRTHVELKPIYRRIKTLPSEK